MPRVKITVGVNDLSTTHPFIALRWLQEKNGDLRPEAVTYGSRKKVWWFCDKGHETYCEINYMANNDNCAICTGKQILVGFNDLATTHQELHGIWHPTKNLPQMMSEFTAGSKRKAWWICERRHEWEATVGQVARGKRCPRCSRSQLRPGENDLLTVLPLVAREWHPKKNGNLTPEMISAASEQKVWWSCPSGHEVLQSVSYRARSGKCSACSGKTIIKGGNDLATKNPSIAAQWHPLMNGELKSSQVSSGSHEKAWWLCEAGHETEQVIREKVRSGKCKTCIGRKILQGFNDLETTHPELSREWKTEKNNGLRASEVSFGSSSKQYWWECSKGHEFQSAVAWRVSGNGCPVCANRLVLEGYNDLETIRPDLANEWHPTKNGSLKPNRVGVNSHKNVWWKHMEGHEWKAVIYSRNAGNSCPVCSGSKTVTGVNDFQTLFPEIAGEWHPNKNLPLRPQDVSGGSQSRVWWVCSDDPSHEWEASLANRAKNRSGCPRCSTTGYDSTKAGLLYFIATVDDQARKVGITNGGSKNDRLKGFGSKGWVVVRTWESEDGGLIAKTEALVLRWLRKEREVQPFFGKGDLVGLAGYSETFSAHYASDQEIIEKIEQVLLELNSIEPI